MPRQPPEPAQDARVIREILGSNDRVQREAGFRWLMNRYWKLVAVVVAQKLRDRREAEDVTQEAFLRAFRALEKLEQPAAFLGWILRIAQNLSTDRLRARKPTVSLDLLGDAAAESRPINPNDEVASVEGALESEEEWASVLTALGELPESYREVVTLRYLEGLDGKAMSQLLGEPEGTIRNRLFRALDKIRRNLEAKRLLNS
ncbi:MAG TPA: RNA polymerase sigma factor [Planctomycetota bacterium]|nr:RNA polymerase sigma factor [Planctomycetota bacterium]